MSERRRFKYSEPRNPRGYRSIGRRALLNALADEYRFGNSVSRLYVSLLAQTVLAQEPKLLKKPDDPRRVKSDAVINLERCGVRIPA